MHQKLVLITFFIVSVAGQDLCEVYTTCFRDGVIACDRTSEDCGPCLYRVNNDTVICNAFETDPDQLTAIGSIRSLACARHESFFALCEQPLAVPAPVPLPPAPVPLPPAPVPGPDCGVAL